MSKKYCDFAQIPNSFLNSLSKYSKFCHLKLILYLCFARNATQDDISEKCNIENRASLGNSIAFAINNKHISLEKDLSYSVNEDFFYKSEASGGYYKSMTFTMIPNKFFEEDLSKIDNISELKILLFIFRQTLGWHKDKIKITISKICEKLDMSRSSATKGIAANIEAGRIYIHKKGTPKGGGSLYMLSTDQNLKAMPEDLEATKQKESPTTEYQEYDYVHDMHQFRYPASRRKDKSWRNVSDKDLTHHHILDAWVELCYVPKFGAQPHKRQDFIKFNAVIKSVKRRGCSAKQFKWCFGYIKNVIMDEEKKNSYDVPFYRIANYIGLAPVDIKEEVNESGDEQVQP